MDRFSSFRRHRKNAAPTAAIAGTGSESATTEIVTAAKKRENASPIAQGQPTPLIKLSVPTSTLPEPSEESRPRASTSQHQSTGVDSTTPASDIQQQQVRNQQVKHERLQFSRSPLHSLLRTSMKRSRRSPSPVTAPPVLPASPTAGLSKQIQSISLPSNDNGASPQSSATAIPSSSTEQGRSVTLKSVFHKHTMPHFLNLSPQEIEQKFQDLTWLERSRMQNSVVAPHGRWTRVSGPHLRLLDRYANIQPWDRNRVRLKVSPGQVDYINASPIVLTSAAPAHAARPPDRYIAMQGPKQCSVGHVWRMVYEQMRSPAVIVMLTETHEGSQEKCFPYFPRRPEDPPMIINEDDEFGDGFLASVHCEAIEETPYGDAMDLRRIVLRVHKKASTAMLGSQVLDACKDLATDRNCGGERDASKDYEDERIVYHFLFKRWPDFGVPAQEDLDSFLGLMRLSAEKNAGADNPRIVHCSAGVGRSGTFIALEHLLLELEAGALENFGTNKAFDWDEAENGGLKGADDQSWRARSPMPPQQQRGSSLLVSEGASNAAASRSIKGGGILNGEAQDPIYTTVNQLREQRRTMVQAESQYYLIYQVLRKLWKEKYDIPESDDGLARRQSEDSSGGGASLDVQGAEEADVREPAAKRFEIDPATVKR